MADANTQKFIEGVTYDLLSRGNLTGSKPYMLQENLGKLGHGTENANGAFGDKTDAAIVSFLSKPGREDFATRVNIHFSRGSGEQLAAFQKLHPPKPEDLKARTIDSYLTQTRPLTSEQMFDLQSKLNATGKYRVGDPTGELGRNTTREVVDYLKDHPKLLAQINPSLLRQMAERNDIIDQPKYDSRQHLAEACRKSPEYMQLASSLVQEFKGGYNYGATIYNMQTVLKAGGFYKGGIDGEASTGTTQAIEAFNKFQNPSKLSAAWEGQSASPAIGEENRQTLASATPTNSPLTPGIG